MILDPAAAMQWPFMSLALTQAGSNIGHIPTKGSYRNTRDGRKHIVIARSGGTRMKPNDAG